ncbi:hypothetical protein B0T10DRAFT_495069 [Thelonectria olida]|uniref:Uncharacterized protein n=1 Tax=Thelonectria olida TaxID=1576542 RepID=A0A9P8VVL9_9HYPO|nr:hypothetical protein B0T10DRAFT_495069 [Thelonectria olida]
MANLRGAKDIFGQFLSSGLPKLHKLRGCTWIEDLIREGVTHSKALLSISAAIRGAFQDGGQDLSVSRLEHLGFALHILQLEASQAQGTLQAGTLTAGILLYTFYFLQGWPCTHLLQIFSAYCLQTFMTPQALELEDDRNICTALESIAVMDLPFFVLGRRTPSAGIWKRFRKTQDTWRQGRLAGSEPITGMPRSLLDIFASADTDNESRRDAVLSFWTWQGGNVGALQCYF